MHKRAQANINLIGCARLAADRYTQTHASTHFIVTIQTITGSSLHSKPEVVSELPCQLLLALRFALMSASVFFLLPPKAYIYCICTFLTRWICL